MAQQEISAAGRGWSHGYAEMTRRTGWSLPVAVYLLGPSIFFLVTNVGPRVWPAAARLMDSFWAGLAILTFASLLLLFLRIVWFGWVRTEQDPTYVRRRPWWASLLLLAAGFAIGCVVFVADAWLSGEFDFANGYLPPR